MSNQQLSSRPKEKRTLSSVFRSGKCQRALVIIAFMFIPLLLLFVFTYLPFFKMVQFSFYNRTYLDEGTWVGLKNYVDVFQRDDIFGSLAVSLYYMGGSVVQLALALFFASLMVFKAKGSAIYKACMFFPYLICGIAVGFIFKFFYAHGYVLDSIQAFLVWRWRTVHYGSKIRGSIILPWWPPLFGVIPARIWCCSWVP